MPLGIGKNGIGLYDIIKFDFCRLLSFSAELFAGFESMWVGVSLEAKEFILPLPGAIMVIG